MHRQTFLDVAKGISIILMTITHLRFATQSDLINEINYEYLIMFKMPMFIIISGYLFSIKKNLSNFFYSKLDSLIKPCISVVIFTTIIALLYSLTQNFDTADIFLNIKKSLVSFLPLWFVISLFISLVIFRCFFSLYENFKFNSFLIFSVLILFTLLILNQVESRFFIFNVSTIIYFIMYLALGYSIKKLNIIESITSPKMLIIWTLLFLSIIFTKDIFSIKLRMLSNVYNPFLFALFYSSFGALMVISLSKYLTSHQYLSKILIKVGAGSFFILAFHTIIGNTIFYNILTKLNINNNFVYFIFFILTIAACLLLKEIFYKSKILRPFFFPKSKI